MSTSVIAWAGSVGTLVFLALWLAARYEARQAKRSLENMIQWHGRSAVPQDLDESDQEQAQRWTR